MLASLLSCLCIFQHSLVTRPGIELKYCMQVQSWVHTQHEGAGAGAGEHQDGCMPASRALTGCGGQQLFWGTPTTVKAALREALLLVVAKCLGSLPCCPSVVVISHSHALFPIQITPGINVSSPRSRMSCCASLLTHRSACEWQSW